MVTARVLAIVRRPTGVTDPKLRELIRADLFDVDNVDADLQATTPASSASESPRPA